MADRYWVGGSGNWNATSTTNWATSSGGASGASAPTSADNVIFDDNSNTLLLPFTVTVTGTTATPALCADFSTSALDGAMTLTMGATAFLDVYGSMTLPATNFSVSSTAGAGIRYKSTTTGKTVTTNGVSLSNTRVSFIGTGGAWTLGSALTTNREMDVNEGSFDTGNFNVSCLSFNVGTAVVKSINLGSSTLTVSGAVPAINIGNVTNLTWNAGTSTIICSSSFAFFSGNVGLTFYNVSFTATGSGGSYRILGANTFNNLTFTSLAASGMLTISIEANQTINGTLTLGTANTAIRRMFMRSDVVGTPRTVTAATVATLADVDFRDIVGAGLGTWTGTRLGNCGGNTGITLDAAKTVYRVGTGNWSATQWSLTSGGSVDVNNFPLAQDTALFDTGTTTGTHTIDAAWNIGNLDMSALNVAVTLASGSTTPTIYGNLTLDADVTLTGTGAISFSGASNQTITSAGVTFTQALTINKPTTTSLILGDALTNNLAFTLTQGTLDLDDFNLTCLTFSSSNTNTRSIAFGTGKIVVTGNAATIWAMTNATNFTYTGTPTTEFNYSGGTGTRAISHGNTSGGTESNAINIKFSAGTDIASLSTGGATAYRNIDFTGFSGTFDRNATFNMSIYGNLLISSTTTVSATASPFTFAATSGTQEITTNNKTLDLPITKQGVGTLQLQDNLTMGSTRAFTLTTGTLDLNNQTLSTGLFVSSNSNTRSIAFGTGNITVTGNNATVFNMPTATNFTYTGTPTVDSTYSGGTGTRTILFGSAGASETNALNFNVTDGTDIFSTGNSLLGTLNFTGFSGTLTNGVNRTIYRDLILSSGMTVSAGTGTTTFNGAGVQNISSAGAVFVHDLVQQLNSIGIVKLQSNFSFSSTPYSHTAGTLDVNDFTLTTGVYSSTGSTARQLDVGTGTLAVGGNFTASGSNYTTAGTGTISMTSASGKTFAGGGFTYPILNQGGAGSLTITGANTFANITNTVQPATVTFPASTTTTVSNFSLLGTAGNLITINSSTSGTQATLYKNTPNSVILDYLNIKDSNATGLSGVLWFGGANSTNSGNNTNWLFISPEEGVASITGTGFLQAIGNRGQQGNGAINAYADVTGIGYRGQQGNASINANANVTALGNFSFSANGTINGYAYVVGLGNATYSGQGSINANATIIANGRIIGDEWVIVPYGTDTWLRQG
jgi:hypothetical protein